MVLIIFDKSNTDEWVARDQYFHDIGNLPEYVQVEGYRFEQIPSRNTKPNTAEILCCNPKTMELYYKYVPNPPSPEELVPQLEQRITELELAIAAVLGGAV